MARRTDGIPLLDRWALLVPSGARLLATPRAPVLVLTGVIHGDARFPDGAAIVTSRVLELDHAAGHARTRTTRYRLGRPSRLFRRWLRDRGHVITEFARRELAAGPGGALEMSPTASSSTCAG
jgi:hypothetical protein